MADDVKPATNEPYGVKASSIPARALQSVLPAAAFLLYVAVLLRMAWVSDDAFITLRALDNFLHGYGLVSNPPERVLGFTNPLWGFLLLIPLGLGVNPYAAALAGSLVVSIAAAYLLVRKLASGVAAASLGALLLALSAAYVDFSTSGLENPLAHCLLALFLLAFFTGELGATRVRAWLLAALIAWNRLDHALFVVPAMLSLCWDALSPTTGPSRAARTRQVARAATLGMLPLLLWLGFALVYYGFPLPNTAYAKLNLELPPYLLARQGFVYLLDSLKRDPLTLLVIGLAAYAMWRERSRTSLAVLAGLLLYLAYVVRIGGDFMTGRFMTAPFFVSVAWLVARTLPHLRAFETLAIAIASGTLGVMFSTSFEKNEKLECAFDWSGIANERECYVQYTGLMPNLRGPRYKEEGRYQEGLELRAKHVRVAVESNVGMTGYGAGPEVHVIDLLALTDPLLARIPFHSDGEFRVGHFHRDEPAGYSRSVRKGSSQLKDPCLRAYYEVLLRVIRGPIFSFERFVAIWDLNRGRYDRLVRQPCQLDRPVARFRVDAGTGHS